MVAKRSTLSKKDSRRYPRIPYVGMVRVGWEDAQGHMKYAQTKCVDISAGGLRIELPEPIPMGSYVTVRADRINLAGRAMVRYKARHGAKFIHGLELSQRVREQALAAFGEPARDDTLVSVS
jgi:hypothetical protein